MLWVKKVWWQPVLECYESKECQIVDKVGMSQDMACILAIWQEKHQQLFNTCKHSNGTPNGHGAMEAQ